MPIVRDDTATTQYLREPPLPVRPTLLAPEPPRRPTSVCPTCPFRQEPNPQATLAVPGPRSPEATATQLLPATGGTGSTTVIQVAAPPPRRRPAVAPPSPRLTLAHLQFGLWLVIAAGLLILAFRPV